MKRFWTNLGVLAVLGALIGGGLYLAFPVQMSTIGGLIHNYFLTLSAPAATLSTESNPAYAAPAGAPAPVTAVPAAAGEDWPSYNRTVSSDRYSPLAQINAANVGSLKHLCTYDVDEYAAFESGLVMVENSLIGTTEFDTFSLNPSTCALNWRVHETYPPYLLPSNRGVAYLDGALFRGTQDGRVLAYDLKTGKRLWETRIADQKLGEAAPAAPIAADGMVFIGNSGGDFKGGKGHMFGLDAKTGKIVWEFFLTPKSDTDVVRGPLGSSPLDGSTWKNIPGIPISGAGSWTSYTLDTSTGELYVPGGNPAPDFAVGVREGGNLYADSVVVLDAKTGSYKRHYQIVPKDWHDWDASNPPILVQTQGGRRIMAVAPKDGQLYGYDLATNNLLYHVPVTTQENVDVPFEVGKWVHFCPGPVGGDEWNSPAYVAQYNLILVEEVDWCYTVRLQDHKGLRDKDLGTPWTGMATLNPFWPFGKPSKADGSWGGWLYAVDADTGVWKWRARSNYPIVAGLTPTAGGVVFLGDVGGTLYALDYTTGEKLFSQSLGGGIGGGIITYMSDGTQKVAVAAGFTHIAWPTKIVKAKVMVFGLGEAGTATTASR
jgi:alcohol dehydrogenase (cytochrome c)